MQAQQRLCTALLFQTTPGCYLNSLPVPAEREQRLATSLFLPFSHLVMFLTYPKTTKLVFIPPIAIREKRKGIGCRSWPNGNPGPEGAKEREDTCKPDFLPGHNLPLGWSYQPIFVCSRILVWEGRESPNFIPLTFILSHRTQSHLPFSLLWIPSGHSHTTHLLSQNLYS